MTGPDRDSPGQTNEAPLKVGIAGLGFGSTEFLPVLERVPQVQLVAAADLRPHALQAFQRRYAARVYQSMEELCRDSEVEAIWIATPNQFHGQHALLAAQHGKHVVIRKPMAITMEDCQRILEAGQRRAPRSPRSHSRRGLSRRRL